MFHPDVLEGTSTTYLATALLHNPQCACHMRKREKRRRRRSFRGSFKATLLTLNPLTEKGQYYTVGSGHRSNASANFSPDHDHLHNSSSTSSDPVTLAILLVSIHLAAKMPYLLKQNQTDGAIVRLSTAHGAEMPARES